MMQMYIVNCVGSDGGPGPGVYVRGASNFKAKFVQEGKGRYVACHAVNYTIAFISHEMLWHHTNSSGRFTDYCLLLESV